MVQKQRPHISEGIIFCAPLIIPEPKSGFSSWHQFVEWVEYLRFIGFKKIFMPNPILNFSRYPFAEDLIRVIDYYRRIDVVETFPAAYYLFDQSASVRTLGDIVDNDGHSFYRLAAKNKQLILSFCTLKYGPMYSHIMVGDFDEVVAFDLQEYGGNVMRAFKKTEKLHRSKYGLKLDSIRLRDFRLVDCIDTSNALNPLRHSNVLVTGHKSNVTIQRLLGNNSRFLLRNKQIYVKLAAGKTIYSSKYPLLVYMHSSTFSLHHTNYLDPEKKGSRNFSFPCPSKLLRK